MKMVQVSDEEERVLIAIADRLRSSRSEGGIAVECELIAVDEVARMLKVSVHTVRRRARTAGDPLFRARSRVGCQKPMHFRRSAIVAIERGRADPSEWI